MGGVFFSVENLVASLERNSIQRRSRFFSQARENKSFLLALFHMARQGCVSLHGPTAAPLYLPRSMPSVRFDISLSTGGNLDGESRSGYWGCLETGERNKHMLKGS